MTPPSPTTPWLHVIGFGPEGVEGLLPTARAALRGAEVVIGADRHHRLTSDIKAERIAWPSPFDALIGTIAGLAGRQVAVLATGDPLWYSVGARIARAFDPSETLFHPQISAFQRVACKLGWSLADLETLTVHGRPVEQVVPFIQPGLRWIVLTTGEDTPAEIARLLAERGFGPSRLHVFAELGGAEEAYFSATAEEWRGRVPPFNTMAVECIAGPTARIASHMPGLPDEAFQSDGVMTKSEVRALALSRLMPMRGQLLWDIGCGSGSVAIEWMRAARDAAAIGIDHNPARLALAAANAARLGAPRLELIEGEAPAALADLPAPDAVFFGGAINEATIRAAWERLKPAGRVVANAVSLEGEAVLVGMQEALGGELVRIGIERAEPLGERTGFRPLRRVTMWSAVKPVGGEQ